MHFLKRNFKTIVLYMLILGTAGALLAYFLAGSTYDYEEYYSLSEPLTTTQEDELSIGLNQEINSQYEGQAASIGYSSESQYLSLNVDSMSQSELSTIKAQFDSMLEEMGIQYEDGVDVTITADSNAVFKLVIIGVSLLVGVILGVIHGIWNRRVETDEDVRYYLNEKTLGIF